ncbi:MAG TPA: HIT domain-containing protein [Rhizomicrobium sp.]
MPDFVLHPRLAADTSFLTDWPLSRVLLMDDARFPWLILVPRRPDAIELHDLTPQDRSILIEEIVRASAVLKTAAGGTKINVATLGNVVSQLHIHVVSRTSSDAAWPGPVWGIGTKVPYDAGARAYLVAHLLAGFAQVAAHR